MRRLENLRHAPWPKLAVTILFTACWFVSAVVRSRFAGGETGLDASWLMGLAASLQQGLISGRDFHFTYGPAAQVFAWIGTFLTVSKSALDGYRMIYLTFVCLSALGIAAALLLYDRISWKQTAIIYVYLLLLNVFRDAVSFRMALLVLSAAFTYRMIAASESRRLFHAAALGVFCFCCQLVTPDIGIYGAVVVVGSTLLTYVLEKRQIWLNATATFLVTLICLNLGIDFVFKATSKAPIGIFDYQWYALEVIRGYNNTMGLDWGIDGIRTMLLGAVVAYIVVLAILVIRKRRTLDSYLIGTLVIASLLGLKGAMVRSDLGHVAYAAGPAVFTFLVLGKSEWNSRIGQAIWCALVTGLFWVLPGAGGVVPLEISKVITGKYPMGSMLQNISATTLPIESVLPQTLRSSEFRNNRRAILPFPYEDYIAIALRRPLLAPVLQGYAALTPSLQRFYVDAVEKQRTKGLDIIYGVDEIAAWAVDGEPTITRLPLIFEYLYTHFNIATTGSPDGHYLLESREDPRQMAFKDLSFASERWSNSSGIAHLHEPTSCGLLRIKMTVSMSYRQYLFRPSGIELTFRREGAPILTVPVRPSEFGRPFSTYVSLINAERFHYLFQDSLIPAPSWDSLGYSRSPADKVSARPVKVELHQVECVNPQIFTEADASLESLDSEAFIPTESSTAEARTGYIVLTTSGSTSPLMTVRLARAGTAKPYRDVIVRPPAARYEINMPPSLTNDVGLAIVNPHEHPIAIDLSYQTKQGLQTSHLTVKKNEQVSKLLAEFFSDDAGVTSGTMVVSSKDSFSLFAARFLSQQFEVLQSTTSSVDNNSPLVFPQFVRGGGWATAVIVSNPSGQPIEGNIGFFSPASAPMAVTMNGSTSNVFRYAVAPGKTYVLRPDSPTGSRN